MNANADSGHLLTEEQGQILVRLARQTISKRLGYPPEEKDILDLEQSLDDEIFQAHCGTFVTLKISQKLRGCIGHLVGYTSLKKGIQENAVNAAFRDPRFSPLTAEELSLINIEVSVLSDPKPLEFTDAEDLLSKLRPHVDGVIIRKEVASSTFLPQVWEHLPNSKDFLSQLCLKAGLSSNAWRKEQLVVSTYQVQYFEESQ
jgi:AmmeMemoRadiSam system protein A